MKTNCAVEVKLQETIINCRAKAKSQTQIKCAAKAKLQETEINCTEKAY